MYLEEQGESSDWGGIREEAAREISAFFGCRHSKCYQEE